MTHQVAKTILNQLGGNKFLAMTGAKNLMGGANALSFHVGRNAKGVKAVRVYLDANDTYTMEFLGCGFAVKNEFNGLYGDMLQEVFTSQTGLYTHL